MNLDRDDILSRLDVPAFFAAHIPGYHPSAKGEVKVRCPWCGPDSDKDGSMNVNAEKQTYKCHRCDEGGDVIRFVETNEHTDFPGALEYLSDWIGTPTNGARAVLKASRNGTKPKRERPPKPPPLGPWIYDDERREPLYRVLRDPYFNSNKWKWDKRCPQHAADGKGGWKTETGNMDGVRRVLYRLADVIAAVEEGNVIICCEGEPNADDVNNSEQEKFRGRPYLATTAPQGAKNVGSVDPKCWEYLRGADVILLRDKDKDGQTYVSGLSRALEGIAASVEVMEAAAGFHDVGNQLAAGHDLGELVPVELEAEAEEEDNERVIPVVDIRTATPTPPRFTVAGFFPRGGLTLLWAAPNVGKTAVMLNCVEAITRGASDRLFGHPDLEILHRWSKVLWVGTEETTGDLRYRLDAVTAGMGETAPEGGEFVHVWAPNPKCRVTLDDLPGLIAEHQPEAVILDSLTGLRPRAVEGRGTVSWDCDNDAANDVCLMLRGLAVEHDADIVIIHHSNKGGKEYRGPTEWWASTDAMIGLVEDDGAIRVRIQKQRNTYKPPSFRLRMDWTADSVTITHDASNQTKQLSPTAQAVVLYYAEVKEARQADCRKAVMERCEVSRKAVDDGVAHSIEAGAIRYTNRTVNRSPVLAYVQPSATGKCNLEPS